jgi:hypothetical protein
LRAEGLILNSDEGDEEEVTKKKTEVRVSLNYVSGVRFLEVFMPLSLYAKVNSFRKIPYLYSQFLSVLASTRFSPVIL